MTAIVDEQVAERPVHVFVVGVSRYLHLDDGPDPSDTGRASCLNQLSSAARSASEFAGWILENVPKSRLASLYVNVAPTAGEQLHPTVAGLLNGVRSATRSSVTDDWKAFHRRCFEQQDATAYIYAAGHGIQLGQEGAILLLENFGAPQESKLWAALDLVTMNKTLRGSAAAALQYWFIDCCRERVDPADYGIDEFRNAYPGLDMPLGFCTAAPIIFATLPREIAWARREGVSLFNEALLDALRGDAATRPRDSNGTWCVTTHSLVSAVNARVEVSSRAQAQRVYLSGYAGTTNEVLHTFDEPPSSSLTLTLDPASAHATATAHIDQDGVNVVTDADDWPVQRELPAGLYVVRVEAEPGYRNKTKQISLLPPSHEQEVQLT